MASPTLYLWPKPTSTSSAEDPEPKQAPNPLPKPKAKRGGSSNKTSSTPKKTPQRGLGVAQLERIRLQDFKKVGPADFRRETQSFPVNLPSVYEQQGLMYGTPVACGGGPAPICCMHPHQYRVGCGYAPASAIRSVLHEQYAMDRVRVGSGTFVSAELPSNQRVACVSDCCEFCVRKKRLVNEGIGFSCGNGVDHCFVMDEHRRNFGESARMGSFVKEREIKEYEFFPHNSIESSGERVVGDVAAASASSAATASNFVDLSLKLF